MLIGMSLSLFFSKLASCWLLWMCTCVWILVWEPEYKTGFPLYNPGGVSLSFFFLHFSLSHIIVVSANGVYRCLLYFYPKSLGLCIVRSWLLVVQLIPGRFLFLFFCTWIVCIYSCVDTTTCGKPSSNRLKEKKRPRTVCVYVCVFWWQHFDELGKNEMIRRVTRVELGLPCETKSFLIPL
jgi:hypothetical protein